MQPVIQKHARPGTVYVVDDDEGSREELIRLIEGSGWNARACASGDELLGQLDAGHPACILLDLSAPERDGIELQRELLARSIRIPLLFLTSEGTVSLAVQALRGGAFDFLQRPVHPSHLIERIEAALWYDSKEADLAKKRSRIESLSEREIEVCRLLVRGASTKQIAQQLGISARTVEHHRQNILKKTDTANAAQLASIFSLARAYRTEGS